MRLERNLNNLETLAKGTLNERKRLLESADTDLLLCLSDCAYNLLNENIPKKMNKYKKQLKLLQKQQPKRVRSVLKKLVRDKKFFQGLLLGFIEYGKVLFVQSQ